MPPASDRGSWVRALAALAAVAAAVVFGLVWTFPPAAAPPGAPPAEFSSVRARVHLEAIARRPHRIGSAEHARVRAYLVEQLRALGLEPAIQEAVAMKERSRPTRFAAVKNVVARRRGTGSGKALLLMAHYDTRSMTPGASDDGYGVATLLETARALRDQPGSPPVSDIVFLFTDGEEEGLLGAHAFASEHPWAADVGLVLNFEARGDAGPVLMFQTGDDNGALVRELGRAAPHPAANSLSQAIYHRMPNDTDLSEWLPRTPALNFANVGGFERYHAPTDTVENHDARTLQHHGSYALALTRAFGARELPLPREGDAVYFNAGPFFVRYPGTYDLPLALAAALLVGLFVALGHRRAAVRPGFAALGVLAALAMVAVAAAATALLWRVTLLLHPDYRLLNAASPVLKSLYLTSFLALAAAIGLASQSRLLRRLRASELFAGSAALFALIAILAAAYLPGAAFLFTWPVLAALPVAIGLAVAGAWDRDAPRAAAAAIALSCPALVLVAPFIPQFFAAFGPHAAPVLGAFAALLAAFAAPAARLVLLPAPRLAPLAALAIACAGYLAASLYAPFDRDHPRPDTLLFAVDGDSGRSWWLSPDPAPDAWTRAALAGATPRTAAPLPFPLTAELLAVEAPAVREPGPEVVWLAAAPAGAGRTLRLRVVPPAGAEMLAVHVEGVTGARVGDRRVPIDDGALALRFYAPPAEGVEIVLATASPAPVVVRAVSQRAGFPSEATPAMGARPAASMAKPGMMPPWDELLESDMTIVARSSTR